MFRALGLLPSAAALALVAAVLVWPAVRVSAAAPAALGAGDTGVGEAGAIAVELNRIEPVSDGCRLSFVIRNHTSHAFASLQWDLVFFDPDGLIAGRIAAEAAPLAAGKTSVKLYDVPRLGCDRLRQVLLNAVLRCETASGDDTPVDCLRLTAPSSRASTDFFK